MAVLTPLPKMQFLTAEGTPLVGGKVYTYTAGTTIPLATFQDSSSGTSNTNPIILDSRGEANIWLGETSYKFKLTDADDVEIWTVDYITAPTTALSPVLAGNVTISTDSSGAALRITQTGTGPVLLVQDSANPDTTPFIITSSGLVGVQNLNPTAELDVVGTIQSTSDGFARTQITADVNDSKIDVVGNRNFVVRTNNNTRMTISGAGATTLAGALTVSSGGAAVTGNSTVTGALGVTAKLTVSSGGAEFTGNVQANNNLDVTGSITATSYTGAWTNIPAGTVMLFVQTTAPTGWTKSTAHDNKALRVVSGAASSGGSVAFTTAFASQAVTGTVASYTLTTADIPSHNHSASSSVSDPGHSHTYDRPTSGAFTVSGGAFTINNTGIAGGSSTGGSGTGISVSTSIGNTGGGGGHSHGFSAPNINLAVQYVDVIIATKN